MKLEEQLLWILDYKRDTTSYEEEVPDKSITMKEWAARNWNKREEKLKKSINFIHSLGLKCDSVGWCRLNLNRLDIDNLLEQIYAFALKEDLYLRGCYSRDYSEFESEWYVLEATYLSNGEWDYRNVKDREGNPLTIPEVSAYKISKYTQVVWGNSLPYVQESFRSCSYNHRFSGVDYYWIRDIGRYNATQLFGLMIDQLVPEFACDRYLSYSNAKNKGHNNIDRSFNPLLHQKYMELGGYLPKLSQMFYDLRVHLPIQLPKNKMPETDFAYVYFNRSDYSKNYALIRKNAANMLLSENVIRQEYLTPVILYETEPKGYYIQMSELISYPSIEVKRKLEEEYEELKRNPKPQRKTSEKDALRLFRKIKRLRSQDFKKGLAKTIRETFVGTQYELLLPYYSITDGGYLSNEYEFLSYQHSIKESQEYAINIEKEELLVNPYKGVVFAKCGDGDVVILCSDGTVKRISHETMDVYEDWDTVAQFFFEALLY